MKQFLTVKSIYKAYVKRLDEALHTIQPAKIHEPYFDAMHTLGASSRQYEQRTKTHIITVSELTKAHEQIKTIVLEPHNQSQPYILTVQYIRRGKVVRSKDFKMVRCDHPDSQEEKRSLKNLYTQYVQGLTAIHQLDAFMIAWGKFITHLWNSGAEPSMHKQREGEFDTTVYKVSLAQELIELTLKNPSKGQGTYFQRLQYFYKGQLQETNAFSILMPTTQDGPEVLIEALSD